jgi:hypothetical protein
MIPKENEENKGQDNKKVCIARLNYIEKKG